MLIRLHFYVMVWLKSSMVYTIYERHKYKLEWYDLHIYVVLWHCGLIKDFIAWYDIFRYDMDLRYMYRCRLCQAIQFYVLN